MTQEPIVGRWYWVRSEPDGEWWPAARYSDAAGQWSNLDTWEDFEREVIEWKLIPLPDELP